MSLGKFLVPNCKDSPTKEKGLKMKVNISHPSQKSGPVCEWFSNWFSCFKRFPNLTKILWVYLSVILDICFFKKK